MIKQVAIIGNGIAGSTAARTIRKRSENEVVMISDETDYHFSRTALMYIYMGHMRFEDTKPYEDRFWRNNRIYLTRGFVEKVDLEHRLLVLAGGRAVPWDNLIIASGSKSNKFGWPGQDLRGVQGLYSYQDLELMEQGTDDIEHAVVVGGGLIGIETVEMLLSRKIPTTFVVREKSWMDFAYPAEESALINRQIAKHDVDFRLATELDEILPDQRGRVRAVRLKGGEEIECQFVALTVGVSPNVDFLEGSGIDVDRGVLVDSQLRTNVPDVYAIGDCAQLRQPPPGRRPIEPVWYTGRIMGETVARTVCGEPTDYDPGVWFNSAKFFDLEWQVYGQVPAKLPEDQSTLYWEHPSGDLAVRINYRRSDEAVTGFNLMGIRYRHELCERWIREGWPIRKVLENLGAANFDPELHRQYESKIVAAYNEQNPGQAVRLKRRRGLKSFFGVGQAS